jgi:hypothetical protein
VNRLALLVTPLALLALAGCGGGSSTVATAPATQAAQPSGPPPGGGGFPGTSGLIAAIQGATLQVQTADAQTAVTFSAKTAITDVVKATAAAVQPGACVSVRDSTATASAPASPASSITATSVTVSSPVGGTCVSGFGGGRRGAPPAGTAAQPRPSFSPRPGGFRGGGGAFGTVASVSGSTFTVSSTAPGAAGGAASTRTITVTETPATTYTADEKATAAALKVGSCVTARGTTDSTGTLAATALSVRPAVNGSCTAAGGPGA